MRKFLQVFGTAAFLTAGLFGITETAKAEMETFTMDNVPMFKCEKGEMEGEYVTVPVIVTQERFVRYSNTVIDERETRRANEAFITWNKALANGRFAAKDRCMAVSKHFTNTVHGMAAKRRNENPLLSMEESYIQALSDLSNISRTTRVVGYNRFGEWINEQVILPEDFGVNSVSGMNQMMSVDDRPTNPQLSTLFTLSGANAIFNFDALEGVRYALLETAGIGGQEPAEVNLPIQE